MKKGEEVPVVGEISDCGFVSNEIPRSRFFKVGIENTIESSRLILIPVHAILDTLRRIASKMICLALHWISFLVSKNDFPHLN